MGGGSPRPDNARKAFAKHTKLAIIRQKCYSYRAYEAIHFCEYWDIFSNPTIDLADRGPQWSLKSAD